MNNKLTPIEREHVARVKALPCSVCGAPGPSEAHHIEQHMQWIAIAVCVDCHRSGSGIHGTKALLKVRKKTELSCLNETIGRLMGQLYSPARTVPAVRERASKLTRPSKIAPRRIWT